MQVISEGPTKITKATIDALWRRRVAGRRLIVRDKDCRGLALIVNQTGMAWSYAYRPRGANPQTGHRWPSRTVTIGNPATHTPDDARNVANRLKGEAAAGGDPAAERKARAETERRNQGATLGRLAEEYARALPRRSKLRGPGHPSPAYVAEEVSQLRLALASLDAEAMPARDLALNHVKRLLAEAEGGNTRARFGALSRYLDWCHDSGHVDANVCTLVARSRRPKAPQARAHYLTLDQLGRLWHAAAGLPEPVWRDFARFLIAVPCRRGEAAEMDWSQVDLAAGEWRQPSQMTKNGEPHRLSLHALALDVLKERRKALAELQAGGDPSKKVCILAAGVPSSGLVFPAPVSGGVLDTFSNLKAKLMAATSSLEVGDARAAKLDNWTWHDFRRSFATALGEAGVPEAVADAILNHRQSATRGGVLGVYQRATRWPEQVKAMQLWGQLLATALNPGKADDKVVPMVTRAG
jgi:integrase